MTIINRIIKRLSFIFTSSYKLAEVLSFASYAERRPSNCEFIQVDGEERVTYILDKSYIDEPPHVPYQCILPMAYYAIVNHGSIIGGSGVVLSLDGYLLHDALAEPDDSNINITDSGLFMLFGVPHQLFGKYITSYKRNDCITYEKGISLVWNMTSNYYHFTFEAAAKMYLVDKAGLDKTIPLLVDQRVLDVPQMKEIVDALNIDKRPVIPVKHRSLCHVETLYCVGPVNKVLCNRKYGKGYSPKVEDFAYDKEFIEYYKCKIKVYSRNCTSKFDTIPERVYLTRRECKDRKCNEEDIIPILERFGFTILQTEKMTLADQYHLFSSAKHIIGTSGAAFTNMVFGDSDSRYLIFTSFRSRNTCYSSLSACIGSQCDFLAGESLYADSKKVNEHRILFYLDSKELQDYLAKLYG